jgi:hypothetical protein
MNKTVITHNRMLRYKIGGDIQKTYDNIQQICPRLGQASTPSYIKILGKWNLQLMRLQCTVGRVKQTVKTFRCVLLSQFNTHDEGTIWLIYWLRIVCELQNQK